MRFILIIEHGENKGERVFVSIGSMLREPDGHRTILYALEMGGEFSWLRSTETYILDL